MPEGHTIHRLAALHTRTLGGCALTVSSPQGRFTDGAKKIDRHVLQQVVAHGKHLFYEFDNRLSVHVHLGLHGSFRMLPNPTNGQPPPPIGQVRMRLVGGTKIVELTGPTACETLDPAGVAKLRGRLGPDVLDANADAEQVWERVHRSRSPVGVLLMDQSVVSGIGNVYRAEVLYRQKIHPLTPGSSLTRRRFDALWTDSVHLLKLGVKHGYILTVDPAELGKPLSRTTRDDRFHIYRRTRCRGCGGPVQQFTLAGRDCFVCPKEQKLPRGVTTERFDIQDVAPERRTRGRRTHGDHEPAAVVPMSNRTTQQRRRRSI